MQSDKITTYLGFCIRAGKISFGIDAILERKKDVYLLVADDTLSENSMKNLFQAKEKFACPLIITDGGELGKLLSRAAVKAVGVREKNLAAAILKEAQSRGQWKIYSEGVI